MSIAAAQISSNALSDMIQLFDAQPWTKQFHEELTELWNICNSRDQQILLKDLIVNFYMLDSDKEATAQKDFNNKFQEWNLDPSNTWIVAVANSDEIDGSTAALQKLKNKILPYEQWHARLISNIPSAAKIINNGDNIVLFDDFIATGKKMVRKVKWITNILNDRNIKEFTIFCSGICGMEFGIQHIKDELKLPVFTSISLKRGISDRYPPESAAPALALMKEVEENLGAKYRNKKLTDYTLGFDQSESLYCAINDNCPNNVFPILWWAIKKDGTPFRTLLQRAG
ncbi:phosphoribosyltransferase-like protein [Burkholderia cenocepacia]|uniref:phosphoribosyltransferase-like protein n=1 Tax=Burkholderia cenocepacia TaxID=95486 RepID=UPI002AB6FF2F|nr:hypothetical protein [Burkholderia cenocepacia]